MTSLSRNMSSVVVVGTALCEHRRTNRSTARQTPGPSCLPAPESTRLSGGGGSGGLCSHPRDLNGTSASSRCSVALESSGSAEWAQLSRGERRLMVCTVCPGHPKLAPALVRRPQRHGARRSTAVPGPPCTLESCCGWCGMRTARESRKASLHCTGEVHQVVGPQPAGHHPQVPIT